MLSLVDCVAFSGLTPEQLDAVACFKRIPPIIAAEWAEQVLETGEGCDLVEAMLVSEAALARDHALDRAEYWRQGLAAFRRSHPH